MTEDNQQKSLKDTISAKGTKHEWLTSTVSMFAFAILTAVALNAFVFQPYEVDGTSMEPTLQHSDRLIVFKMGKTWSSIVNSDYIPDRGDIVVFNRSSSSDKVQLIKRVVGLPGDIVSYSDGKIVVVNDDYPEGFVFEDKYDLDLDLAESFNNTAVSSGEVFVVGDNRLPSASLDSRSSLGNVDVDNIVGELTSRIYPISGFKFF